MRLGEFFELQLRIAMSVQEAKDALGFRQSDEPTKDEIAKAYKNLAFQHHPDRGGDPAKMVEINVAKDVLEGKQKATAPSGPTRTYQPQTWTTREQPPPKPVHITFEEATQKAGVPPDSEVDWKFRTNSGRGGYGDRREKGFVVYGKSKDAHVFVAIYSVWDIGDQWQPKDIDTYEMWVQKVPLSKPLSTVGPRVIRQLWNNFGKVKKYNAKVQLVRGFFRFKDFGKIGYVQSRDIAFKTALQEMGEDVPEKWKGKLDITLEMGEEMRYDNDPKMKWCYQCCRPVLVVNGKEYKLGDKAARVIHANDLYSKMWGKKYWYCGDSTSRKKLNRVKNAKKVLTFLANVCSKHGEPKDLVEALQAAAEKAK